MPEFDRDQCFMQGRLLEPLLLDDLTRSNLSESTTVLQSRFVSEHYLYLKNVFSREEVAAVRSEVFTRLHAVGEIETAGPGWNLYGKKPS